MKKPVTRHCAINVRRVPVSVRDQFKRICEKQGKSMFHVIIDLIKKYIKDHHETGESPKEAGH